MEKTLWFVKLIIENCCQHLNLWLAHLNLVSVSHLRKACVVIRL